MEKEIAIAYVSLPKGKQVPAENLCRFFQLYLEDYNLNLRRIYVDDAGKGFTRGEKPAFKKLLADKAAGKFQVVLIPACSLLSKCYVDAYQDVKTLIAEPHPVAVHLMRENIWIECENDLLALQYHFTVMEQVDLLHQNESKLRKQYKTANPAEITRHEKTRYTGDCSLP